MALDLAINTELRRAPDPSGESDEVATVSRALSLYDAAVLASSLGAAEKLESDLANTTAADRSLRLTEDLKALRATCTACHAAHRDARRADRRDAAGPTPVPGTTDNAP